MNIKLPIWNRVLTVDPGLGGTGWCLWPALCEVKGDLCQMPSSWGVLNSSKKDWQDKSDDLWEQFSDLLAEKNVYQVVIEMPELWTTGKSMASVTSGDLFKLVYLIGGMSRVSNITLSNFGESRPPVMIKPREWKGQLPKDVVIARIKKLCPACSTIGNHEADAVGMGFALQGRL